MKWIVREIHGAFYSLLSEDLQRERLGVLRGKHRIDRETHPSGIPFRNPICVGDRVQASEDDPAAIESVEPRRNVIFRSAPSEIHKLGSNVDRALLVISLKTPPLRTGFIDRFLLSARAGDVPVWIIFTKPDLLQLNEEEDRQIVEYVHLYESLGIRCFCDNLTEPGSRPAEITLPGLADLLQSLDGTTLLCGPSGAGKSTLTNLILMRSVQKTSHTSGSTGKGRHTTTSSQLFPLEGGGFLIDTPGIKEWGVAHLSRKDILELTQELAPGVENCQFRNCEHMPGTDGCGVIELLEKGVLAPSRRKSLDLILEERHLRIRPGDYKKATGRLRPKGVS